jgi:hypothetical protein
LQTSSCHLTTDRRSKRRVAGPETTVTPIAAPERTHRRGGGPRTEKGKQIASRNATRHGIFSRSPIIGDETLEDWEEHHAGMRRSLHPVGHLEDTLVYQLAVNRWQRFRLDHWSRQMVQNQIDAATLQSRDELDLVYDALPDDERLWLDHDAAQVVATLDRIADSDDTQPINANVAGGVLLSVAIATTELGGATRPMGSTRPPCLRPKTSRWSNFATGSSSCQTALALPTRWPTPALVKRLMQQRCSRSRGLSRSVSGHPRSWHRHMYLTITTPT